ncbi:MAG: efflux RND transporter permease subunit [Planctomycetota bacterium]|jgi:multidrug efflux pump subunit AcrB|nr:efflux RND transporter permease subunit [Planctomycetota bacterium]
MSAEHTGIAGRMAAAFVSSKLTPLLVIAALLLGILATMRLPREEEPQIVVPMIDVFVAMPGSSAKEIAERVTRPMEQLLWEVPGVEYVYSTSQHGGSMVVVRFMVGEDPEGALIRLRSKLEANYDRIPQGVSPPLIKPRSIDDVPIVSLTFHGDQVDHFQLRRVAREVESRLKALPDVAETTIIGGYRRTIQVELDPDRLASRGLDPLLVEQALGATNQRLPSGVLVGDRSAVLIETGAFFTDVEAVADTVVGVWQGRPVYLREVAQVSDASAEPEDYVFHADAAEGMRPAVTLAMAKRPGTNAVAVADRVWEQVNALQGTVIPSSVTVTETRNYGATALEKSNELLLHMGIAVFGVALLIWFMLGWRESVIVLIAIPATLALTLAVFSFGGYTLNRITLFALIFSIGILVDDAIVVVENIVRHLREGGDRSVAQVAVSATAEVGNPTILATWAVIAAILPMAGVGGLMGPYMRPIPVGASAAMVWSLLVAFIVTPWAASLLLRRGSHGHEDAKESWSTRSYRQLMDRLIHRPLWRWGFLGGITVLLLGSMGLVGIGWVEVKMLPFDNKSEFQVQIEMPEGTPLEETAAVAQALSDVVVTHATVTHAQVYVGAPAPFNFNGLVRHSYLRTGNHQAEIQVNLVGKHDRSEQSHAVAVALRQQLQPIAEAAGAVITVAEVPPGPPVLQTLVAEIYAPTDGDRLALAGAVKNIMANAEGVVDVDWYVPAPQDRAHLTIDTDKAAINGISTAQVAATVSLAVDGRNVGLLHDEAEREDVPLTLRLPRERRSDLADLNALRLRGAEGRLVPLSELVSVSMEQREQDIYHKNLLPVIYVVADVAGAVESPVYAILAMNEEIAKLDASAFGGTTGGVRLFNAAQPASVAEPAIKWDGEWHITIEVFRDLGIAFAIVLVLIYLLMVGWFRSFVTPVIVMVAIPFSLVGIMPAHGAMGAFFTATSMIGFMAGAGIVVRNSIILVDFIELRRREGMPLDKAVVDAGAVRFRPMLLTALAVVVGAAVILADPIFQGLAISLMAGEIASLFISRMAVPVLYHLVHARGERKQA